MENEKAIVPEHVAIIPDGNRRWAKEKGWEGTIGHEKAVEEDRMFSLMDEARSLGLKYISLWAFSTENWKRGVLEKKLLFNLLVKTIKRIEGYLIKNKVKFKHLGRRDRLPKNVISTIEELESKTANNDSFSFFLLLDYGGRDEILRGVNTLLKEGKKEIGEGEFRNYLDTKDIPDPELIIRTGGEKRMSGFMSFQSAYSEWYFTDQYFPDFGAKELREAVKWFSNRKRRFGGD